MLAFLTTFLHHWYSTLTVGFIVVFILKATLRRRRLPPGPYCLPIFGSVGFFRAFRRRRHLALSDLAEKYGNIYAVYAGTQMVVFLHGYEVIREAFVKKASVFSDRPNWLPSLQLGLSEGKGLVWQDAAHAPPARKFALQALREFGLGKTSLQDKVLREVASISDVLHQNIGQPFRLKSTLKKAITNVIHDIIFGQRYEYDDAAIENLIFLIDEFFRGGIFIPKNFLPKFINKFLPKGEKEYQRKQKIIGDLKRYMYDKIAEHETDFDGDNIRDFIDIYIQASTDDGRGDSPRGYVPTKGEVFRMILDLFLAGSETTASTLDWCFMFMVKYPGIQEKCFQEIAQTTHGLSDEDFIEWSCKSKLPYVEATLAEVQRFATIVPLGLPHVTSQTVTLRDFVIPENTIVFANIHSCSMDGNVWNNATEFNPSRHLDDQGRFKRNEKLIPFSLGPRMCLGDSMAKLELFLIFTNLIKRFMFTKHGDSDLSATHIKENHPVSGAQNFEVLVSER